MRGKEGQGKTRPTVGLDLEDGPKDVCPLRLFRRRMFVPPKCTSALLFLSQRSPGFMEDDEILRRFSGGFPFSEASRRCCRRPSRPPAAGTISWSWDAASGAIWSSSSSCGCWEAPLGAVVLFVFFFHGRTSQRFGAFFFSRSVVWRRVVEGCFGLRSVAGRILRCSSRSFFRTCCLRAPASHACPLHSAPAGWISIRILRIGVQAPRTACPRCISAGTTAGARRGRRTETDGDGRRRTETDGGMGSGGFSGETGPHVSDWGGSKGDFQRHPDSRGVVI